MIETARLRLRPWREADRAGFVGAFNTPAVMQWLGGVRPAAEIGRLLDKRLADQARDGFCYWAVETLADEELVASCGVRRGLNYAGTPVDGLHEIGWRVAEAHWRKGFAREAAEATVRWFWTHVEAPLLAAWTTRANGPSWGLMERLGMTRRRELDFRPGVATEDLIVYTLDRPR